MSVINNPLTLNSVFKVAGVVTDLTGGQAFYDYFKPGNFTNEKDGTFTAVVAVGTDGEFSYDIPGDILNVAGKWKFQPYVILDGNTYHEETPTCEVVVDLGGSCG